MVRNPSVFLFDEPLSNLDAKLRTQMRTEIKLLHQKVQTTIIYVTHDQVEAMTLADRIVVMRGGYIEQVGEPLKLFQEPANTFVGREFYRQSLYEFSSSENCSDRCRHEAESCGKAAHSNSGKTGC